MELSFGQYASSGVVSIWKICPLFQGEFSQMKITWLTHLPPEASRRRHLSLTFFKIWRLRGKIFEEILFRLTTWTTLLQMICHIDMPSFPRWVRGRVGRIWNILPNCQIGDLTHLPPEMSRRLLFWWFSWNLGSMWQIIWRSIVHVVNLNRISSNFFPHSLLILRKCQ